MSRPFVALIVILLFGAFATSQSSDASKNPVSGQANPMSGEQLYASYCALCHGADGKGGGPFSTQLKVWPPDLTQLAKKNHGVFPSLHLAEIIDGEFGKAAHGSKEMPVWGPAFRSMAHGRRDSAQRRIENLVNFLESLQAK